MELFARPKELDITNNLMTLDLAFWDDDLVEHFEGMLQENKYRRIVIPKAITAPPANYEQYKKWFVCMRKLLEHYKVPVTGDVLKAFHMKMKEAIFPVEMIDVGGIAVPSIPSLTTMSKGELAEGIQKLIDRYALINVDLSSP